MTDHLDHGFHELTFLKNDVITILERFPHNRTLRVSFSSFFSPSPIPPPPSLLTPSLLLQGECEGVIGIVSEDQVRFLDIPAFVARAQAKARRKAEEAEGDIDSNTPDYRDPPPYTGDEGKKKEKKKDRDREKEKEGERRPHGRKEKERDKDEDSDDEERRKKEERRRRKKSQALDPSAVVISEDTASGSTTTQRSSAAASSLSSAQPTPTTTATYLAPMSTANPTTLHNFAFTFTPGAPQQHQPLRATSSTLSETQTSKSTPGIPIPSKSAPPKQDSTPNPSTSHEKVVPVRVRATDDSGLQPRREYEKISGKGSKGENAETSHQARYGDNDDERIFITGLLSKKNERLMGWARARKRAWKEYALFFRLLFLSSPFY